MLNRNVAINWWNLLSIIERVPNYRISIDILKFNMNTIKCHTVNCYCYLFSQKRVQSVATTEPSSCRSRPGQLMSQWQRSTSVVTWRALTGGETEYCVSVVMDWELKHASKTLERQWFTELKTLFIVLI